MDAAKMEKQAKRKVMMQLHIVSGSFCPQAGDDAAGAGGGCPMDASVWSRLPDDMVWRVLGLLPPAKRFQLHCVSRGWRLMLTSPHFRNTYAIAHAAAAQQQRSLPVVACVTPYASDAHQLLHTRRSKAKVVDVDLSSFVPSWFWEPHTDSARNRYEAYRPYSLVAAGDGLVCIRNDTCQSCRGGDPEMLKAAPRYCVLNPVTRTCVVLPPAPFGKPMMFRPVHWLHPSATAVSMCRWSSHEATATPRYNNLYVNYDEATCCEVATCDLAAAAAGGPRWTVLHSRVDPPQQLDRHMRPPLIEHCGGETFSYLAGRVHVLAPGPGPALPEAAGAAKRRRLEEGCGAGAGHRMLVEAADAVAGPSVALLGLDPAAVVYGHNDLGVELVAHRGAIFLVARLMRPPWGAGGTCTPHPALVAGVWRLARRTMAWEPVSLLDTVQAKRLVQQSSESCGWSLEGGATLFGAFVVRDLLSCELGFGVDECPCRFTNCVVGLDVDAGKWELVVLHHHHEERKWRPDSRKCDNMVELNPDLFLS